MVEKREEGVMDEVEFVVGEKDLGEIYVEEMK